MMATEGPTRAERNEGSSPGSTLRRLPAGFREPPNNLELEQLLLGSVIVNQDSAARVRTYLKPEHFYEPRHARIFEAVTRVNGRLFDYVQLGPEFNQAEEFRELGGAEYITKLAEVGSVYRADQADEFARELIELSSRRHLIDVAQETINRAFDLSIPENVDDQLDRLRGHLDKLSHETPRRVPAPHVDLSRLAQPLPQRRFLVPDWVPIGHITSIYGEGSSGKSFLAMMLATCLSGGIPWLGTPVSRCRVLGFFCEDNDEELLIRENKILNGLSLKWTDVVSNLFFCDRVGFPNTLMTFEQGISIDGPAMRALMDKIDEVKPQLVILDNIGHMYGGNENDRFQVTTFLNRLAGIARKIDGAVVLLGHPPKSEAQYSGSTAWSNNVRSRLWLEKCKDDDDRWILKRSKTNYAEPVDLLLVRDPISGLVRPDDPAYETSASRDEADRKLGAARQHLKAAIDALNAREINTAPDKRAPNNLLRVLEQEEMVGGFKRRVLQRALDSLLISHEVEYAVVGKHPKGMPKKGLVRTATLV